jgi:hypothetical protein
MDVEGIDNVKETVGLNGLDNGRVREIVMVIY